MWHQAKSFDKFYSSDLGLTCSDMLKQQIEGMWESGRNLRVLSCGYPIPLLEQVTRGCEKTLVAVPESIGSLAWIQKQNPKGLGLNTAVCIESGALPFSANAFDRLIVSHFLELSPHLAADLFELHRVLQPEGQMLLIVPNRMGLWSQSDRTPFGQGVPFSGRQIKEALIQAGFQIESLESALYFAPHGWRYNLRFSGTLERFMNRIGRPAAGGVWVVKARKRVLAPTRPKGLGMRLRELWALAPRPGGLPVPQPASVGKRTRGNGAGDAVKAALTEKHGTES